MRGFQIVDGDMIVGQQGYAEVVGQAKVLQDMVFAAREPYGCDPYHPGWGTLLANYIGTPAQSGIPLAQNEVIRLVNNYMTVQQAIQAQAVANNQRSPYTNDDFVTGIGTLNVQTSTQSVTIAVSLSVASGSQIAVTQSVSS